MVRQQISLLFSSMNLLNTVRIVLKKIHRERFLESRLVDVEKEFYFSQKIKTMIPAKAYAAYQPDNHKVFDETKNP